MASVAVRGTFIRNAWSVTIDVCFDRKVAVNYLSLVFYLIGLVLINTDLT